MPETTPEEKFPLIVLHWRSTDRTPHLLKFVGFHRSEEDGRRIVEIAAGRLCTAFAILLAATLITAATTLYFWLDSSPHNQISYADIVLPWRWNTLYDKRGLTRILDGIEAAEKGNDKAAYICLRSGLARHPDHPRGRLALARIYFRLLRSDLAFRLLEDGLEFGLPDDDYLNTLLSAAAGNEYYELGLRVADKIERAMSKAGRTDWDQRLLQYQLEALLKLERYTEILERVQPLNKDITAPGKSYGLEAISLARTNRAAEAITVLENATLRQREPAPLLRVLAELYRGEGNVFGMNVAMRRLLEVTGFTPDTELFMMTQWYALGQPDEINPLIEDFLHLQGSDIAAVKRLAMLAEAWDDEGTIRRCLAEAERRGLPTESVLLALATQQLKSGETINCLHTLSEMEGVLGQLPTAERVIYDFLHLLASSLQNTESIPPELVRKHMLTLRLPLTTYPPAYKLVRRIGGPVPAIEVLKVGRNIYPYSRRLLEMLKEAGTEIDDLNSAATQASLQASAEDFKDPEATRARLDALRADGNWAALASTIAALQYTRPPWLVRQEPLLRLMRIEALLHSGRSDDARVLVRLHRDGSIRADRELDTLYNRLAAAGLADAAEILKKRPSILLAAGVDSQAASSFVIPAGRLAAISEMQGMVNAAQWDDADAWFRQLSQAKPAWFDPNAPEWTRLRLRVAVAQDDEGQITNIARIHLLSRPDDADRLLALAWQAHEEGDKPGAILLAREIVSRFPRLKGDAVWAEQQAPRYDFNDSETVLARFEALKLDGRWDELAAAIADLEQARPAWSIKQEPQLRLMRIEALLRESRLDSAGALIKLHRNGSARAEKELTDLYNRLNDEGLAAEASILLDRRSDAAIATGAASPGERQQEAFSLPENRTAAISEMQGMVNAARWDEAEAWFDQLTRARPAWFDANAPEWTRLRLRVAVARAGELQIAAITQIHLLNRPDSASQLLALARQAHAEGDTAGAIMLANEILRRFPELRAEAGWMNP